MDYCYEQERIKLRLTKSNTNKTIVAMHRKKFYIEQRRKKVASLLAQSMNETDIATILKVDQSTISRDITALKEMSRNFVYDLAKSDLAFHYKLSLDGIEEVKKKAWQLVRSGTLNSKEELLALKLIKECNESTFGLCKDGPCIMNMQSLEERLVSIESARENYQ
jgi:hypothetical protein